MSTTRLAFLLVLAGLLAGCGSSTPAPTTQTDTDAVKRAEDPYHTDPKYNATGYNPKTQEGADSSGFSVTGFLFGGDRKGNGGNGVGLNGVGVNTYLWHAALDTLSFMPLASADPFGGVIISDWYSPADLPNERFKLNVLILGRELHADAVRVSLFRQKRDPGGQWVEAPVEAKTSTDLENAILLRARQLRINTAAVK